MDDARLLKECLLCRSDQALVSLLKPQSDTTKRGIRSVLKDMRLREALTSLLPFPGLLLNFQFGKLQRIWIQRYLEVGLESPCLLLVVKY